MFAVQAVRNMPDKSSVFSKFPAWTLKVNSIKCRAYRLIKEWNVSSMARKDFMQPVVYVCPCDVGRVSIWLHVDLSTFCVKLHAINDFLHIHLCYIHNTACTAVRFRKNRLPSCPGQVFILHQVVSFLSLIALFSWNFLFLGIAS